MPQLKIEVLFNHPVKNKGMLGYSEDSLSFDEIISLENIIGVLNVAPEFFKELELFATRNQVSSKRQTGDGRVCMRCFKAFLIKKSKEYNLDEVEMKVLVLSLGSGYIGHNGYYLDGENAYITNDLNI